MIPRLTASGYVFPIYGQASFTDSFNAPRATTGWHHGEDIFAPLGTGPAVADGIVYSVGWNKVGGLRFWLKTSPATSSTTPTSRRSHRSRSTARRSAQGT